MIWRVFGVFWSYNWLHNESGRVRIEEIVKTSMEIFHKIEDLAENAKIL